ncbi:hypothetical protein SACC_26130 [Saccharolobus caldissimus]|uniref:Uncharacterized protein n=2 Tax=Saccharolobus caldissimus TaxID=1702097 RepID=A0AAQ4CUW5_9CREN|nr:hypothetical protein SACC_26130 [Saccharolobus caldissimus]
MSSSFSDFTVFNQPNANLKTLSIVLGISYYRGKVEQLLSSILNFTILPSPPKKAILASNDLLISSLSPVSVEIVSSLGYKFLYYEYYLWVGSLYLGKT